MAGDYIPWVKGLVNRREVVAMAVTLKLPRLAVAAACMVWWEWCDSEGVFDASRNCHAYVPDLSFVDEYTSVTGLGAAMLGEGWIVETTDEEGKYRLTMPKLGIWIGKSAKERISATERKRAQRERESLCHGDVTKPSRGERDRTVTREEKRREEKSSCTDVQEPPIPPSLETDQFRAAWVKWLQHRAESRKPLRATAKAELLLKLEGMGPTRAIAAIEHSIANGYQGVFEPDQSLTKKARRGPVVDDGVVHPDDAAARAKAIF